MALALVATAAGSIWLTLWGRSRARLSAKAGRFYASRNGGRLGDRATTRASLGPASRQRPTRWNADGRPAPAPRHMECARLGQGDCYG
jgi:hypothetical protein